MILPIELWREIASERETAYLFKSETMKQGLLFDASAFEDLTWRVEQDRAEALRILRLIGEIQREPFSGLGKPAAT